MKKLKQILFRDGRGDIAIEALFGLIVFILAYMGVLMFSSLMRIEATTQYAVDQVAKEVSQYYYVLDRANLLPNKPSTVDITPSDKALENGYEAISGLATLMDSDLSDPSSVVDQVNTVGSNANAVYETLKGNDWGEQITNVLSLTIDSVMDKAFGKFIAGPVCKMLFEKYIPAEDPNEYFKSYGIEQGMADLDFTYSTFLQDGYTINVVLVYKLNLKDLTFGMFDKDVYIRQVGSTQAWVYYKDDKNDEQTLWDIESFEDRGKGLVAALENNYGESIAPGVGFDAYDASSKTLTEIQTLDLYDTACVIDGKELDTKILRQRLQSKANNARKDLNRVKAGTVINVNGEEITLTGEERHQLVIVMPEEAKSQFGSDIEKVRSELGDYGVDIVIEYKYQGK